MFMFDLDLRCHTVGNETYVLIIVLLLCVCFFGRYQFISSHVQVYSENCL